MAAASGYIQYLHESAPNSEHTANSVSTVQAESYLPATDWQWTQTPQLDDRTDELRGIADPLFPDVAGQNGCEHTMSMRLYPNYLGVLLTNMLGAGSYAAGDGVIADPDGTVIPVGANRWTWLSSSLPVLPKTAQIILAYKDESTFFKFTGAGCDQIKLGVGQQGSASTIQATHKSLYVNRISDPSLTPTYDATTVKPLLRAQHSIPTWLPNTGIAVDIDYTFDCPVELDWSMGSGSKFPDLIDRSGVGQKLSGNLTLRYVNSVDWDAFINSTAFTVESKWVSSQNIGATNYPYKLFILGRAQYTGASVDSLKRAIRLGQQVPFTMGYDGTSAYAFKVVLVNATASYSSV